MGIVEGWRGRFYEDFHVGDIYRSRVGRTVSEADNTWFTLLTNNTNQLHYNRQAAQAAGMPDCIVNSALTLAIIAGLSVIDVSENGVNLGWKDIELPSPVYPGDTLYAQSEVLEVRESRSRLHMGVVTVRTEGLNQRGVVVVRYVRTIFVWKNDSYPSTSAFPEPVDETSERLALGAQE